ncbi:hypothetical protein VC83_09057 [Pseudogymnoascus destructans]|uniref:Uncharacterized protein n=1 Tax=Pseudogymnoascus destructans TaxID=655981 RepID=A0A176ZXA6_9PEZI|nr:uncharacterized protein VC83_09057 [Pseudogymnoascus destructans]OAF54589.1 hypothetical protein VC83_09057 [Pseudogymnoascus destructans]
MQQPPMQAALHSHCRTRNPRNARTRTHTRTHDAYYMPPTHVTDPEEGRHRNPKPTRHEECLQTRPPRHRRHSPRQTTTPDSTLDTESYEQMQFMRPTAVPR